MKRLMIITLGILGIGTAHAADTCVKTHFNVTYSCGDGTLVGTLPADTTVNYGSSFTPESISTSICTPPAGGVISGMDIYSGDELLAARVTSSSSFSYYYTTDITITPHYLPIANIYDLAANLSTYGSNSFDNTTMTWTIAYSFGLVKGVAKCSDILPENTAGYTSIGFVPMDQAAIENSENGSGYRCYCKMTEPYLEDNPWVLHSVGTYTDKASYCLAKCAQNCVSHLTYGNSSIVPLWNAGLFSAAVQAAMEQAQQQE